MTPVILLPGLACDEGLWTHQQAALAARGAVHVSRVHMQHASLEAMADALLAEHPGPLHLVGASMGGMLALHAALRAPQRVASLALLGTTARADTPELIRLRAEACALFEQGRVDEVLRANLAFAFHPANQADAALLQAYLAMIHRAGAAQLIGQNRAVMARPDLRPRLPGLRCPTLVAVGEADALTPAACAQEIAEAVPHARLHTVAGAGHMLTLEQPEAVTHLLLDWLST